ncbi:MAG: hypothetical protein JNM63_16645, partial [Spirochaetia bacterium]|nr:hypothetical protein [Spirochaetia bacterium]
MKRFLFLTALVTLLALSTFAYFHFYFVFGEGSKAGELNLIVKKGFVWKTWEGRLIQTGYKAGAAGAFQSNEFEFSVVDEVVAATLMTNSGATLEVRYKEYLGTLPWRGMSKYVVT